MKKDNHAPTDPTQMRVENEMKQLNLEMKYGAMFHTSGEMPLEMEAQWLDYITEFEEKYENTTETTVYNFIGQPEFKPIEQLTPEEMKTELDRLFEIMEANDVNLAILADDTPVEDIYRFVTEEFFTKAISDFRIAGMGHNFIYEEFHPNHKYDLKQEVEDFFLSTMNLKSDFIPYFLSPVMVTDKNSEAVEKEVYEKRIEAFKNQYKSLKINELKILDIDIKDVNEDAKFAGVEFYLAYEGVLKATNKRVHIKGQGYFNFVYTDYWLISRIFFPGFGE